MFYLNRMLIFCICLSASVHGYSQVSQAGIDQYTAGRKARLERLNDAKFGLFIHWGPYAVLAGEWQDRRIHGPGEWIMYHGKIPVEQYEKMAKRFNPVKFDAEEWVRLAEQAGMRYMVITAKHCDGFAMFDSEVTPYNIVDWTPFGRDVIAELKKACENSGLGLGFYYSHWWDWHERNALGHENTWDFPNSEQKDPDIYLQKKSLPQVRELVTRYDPFIMWFDVPGKITREQSFTFLKTVRRHDPGIIINNRIGNDMGDYDTPEQYLPSGSSTFEVCMTMNDTWGYKYYDHNWKSVKTVIQNLADIAHKGGNYLLNVGPTAEGVFPQASVRILQQTGQWMAKNGESIYATTASPLGRLPFNARCTAKPGTLFIHVFDWPVMGELVIPRIKNPVTSVTLLADPGKKPLPFDQKGSDLFITLDAKQIPARVLNTVNNVLAIDYRGEFEPVNGPYLIDPGNPSYLTPDMAGLSGENLSYEFNHIWGPHRGYQVKNWTDPDATMSWAIRAIRSWTYDVYLQYGAPAGCGANECEFSAGDITLRHNIRNTGGWYDFEEFLIGSTKIETSEYMDLTIKPVKLEGCSLMNLKQVKLVPVIK